MLFFTVLTPISTTSGIYSTDNTRKYQQIDVYIYYCADVKQIILKDNLISCTVLRHKVL